MEYQQIEYNLPEKTCRKSNENNAIESIAKQLLSIEEQKKSLLQEISNFLPSSSKVQEVASFKLVKSSIKLLSKNEQMLTTIQSAKEIEIEEEPIELQKPLDFKLSELSTTMGDENSEGRIKESYLYKQMTSFLFSIPHKSALKFLGQTSPRSECKSNSFAKMLHQNKSEDALAEQLSAMVGQIDWKELNLNSKNEEKKHKHFTVQQKKIKKQQIKNKRQKFQVELFNEAIDSDAVQQLLQESMPNFDEHAPFHLSSLDDNNEIFFKQPDFDYNDLFTSDCLSNNQQSIGEHLQAPIIIAEDLIISQDQQKKFRDPSQQDYESQKILDLYSHITVIEQMLNQTKEQLQQLLQ